MSVYAHTYTSCECRKLRQLQQELEELQRENTMLIDTLDLRTKQFHLLLHTIHDLDMMLSEEEQLQQ